MAGLVRGAIELNGVSSAPTRVDLAYARSDTVIDSGQPTITERALEIAQSQGDNPTFQGNIPLPPEQTLRLAGGSGPRQIRVFEPPPQIVDPRLIKPGVGNLPGQVINPSQNIPKSNQISPHILRLLGPTLRFLNLLNIMLRGVQPIIIINPDLIPYYYGVEAPIA